MKNPHIVVREDGGCLCGQYEVGALKELKNVGCSDILKIMHRLRLCPKKNYIEDIATLYAVIGSHVKDCE